MSLFWTLLFFFNMDRLLHLLTIQTKTNEGLFDEPAKKDSTTPKTS